MNIAYVLCVVFSMVCAYLLGSINFAIIFTKIAKGVDIRSLGSGNAGFTNVLRSAGKAPAFLTLLCDFSKGIFSILIVRLLLMLFANTTEYIVADYLVCYCALIGHVFPVYYGFKGGKGILVTFGALMALSPIAGLICLFAFLVTLLISRYVSLGSLVAAIVFPVSILLMSFVHRNGDMLEFLMAVPVSILVIILHRQNIKRLINHTESKISVLKK